MALATGLFNTNTGNPAELNARSFAATILRLFPNGSAPMFAFSSQSGRSKAKASTHGYFNRSMTFQTITMAGTQLIGDTTYTVPSTAGIVPGMVFYNVRTKENIRVLTVPSGTTMTVTRAFGRIAAAAVNAADKLIQAGTAYEEGSNRPVARRLTTVYVPNYTQIFRNAWALTDTARASYAEAGISNVAENRKDCMLFHSVDIESAIIWGQPKMDTTGTTPVHATQGILDALAQYAPANVNTASSTTNYSQLITLLEPAFLYSTDLGNPNMRVLFCDNLAMKVITDIGRLNGQVQIMQNADQFGVKFTSFQFYKGTLNLVNHPLLNGIGATGMAIAMDMGALKLAYMDGRDTKPEEYNIGGTHNPDNGADAQGGSLTTELAVELVNPYACAVVNGLTAGAAG